MSRTGSLINNLMTDNPSRIVPEVGMGATELCYSDRHAYTVVDVNAKGTRIIVQQDKATRTDNLGMTDCQSYSYEPNPNAPKIGLRLCKNGRWVRAGETQNGIAFILGRRDEHYDFTR